MLKLELSSVIPPPLQIVSPQNPFFSMKLFMIVFEFESINLIPKYWLE
jgi:hypothetical protein